MKSQGKQSPLFHTFQSQNRGKKNLGFSTTKFVKVCALVLFSVFSLSLENWVDFSRRGYAATCEAPSVCSDSTVVLSFQKACLFFFLSWNFETLTRNPVSVAPCLEKKWDFFHLGRFICHTRLNVGRCCFFSILV